MLSSHAPGTSLSRLTVRLTPLTVIEPLGAMNRASSAGALTRSSKDSPTAAKWRDDADAVDVPAHQVPAEAIAQPQRLLEIDEIARVEIRGPCKAFGGDVDAEACGAVSSVVTVMQAPLSAMLSPGCTSSRYVAGVSMVSRLPCA